ncbi:MAG: acyl-ACP--UDP-N-acetylglucosamine O-acyltransferase [Desulfobacterales bacterium]
MIHPTAIIDKQAQIGNNVEIGPYTIVRDNVVIGDNSVIGPHVVIERNVSIGSWCRIFQFASVGAIPQDLKYRGEETYVTIGDHTVVREFVTINRGTELGGGRTEIGDSCLLMAYCHIAHDCRIGKLGILANCATLAGHVTLGDYVSIGGLTAVHQFVTIGNYAYIGGASAVVKDIPPYVLAAGDRARLQGLNKVGLKRHGFSDEVIGPIKKAYRIIFRLGLTRKEAVERVKAEVEQTPEVGYLLDFVRGSERGITR